MDNNFQKRLKGEQQALIRERKDLAANRDHERRKCLERLDLQSSQRLKALNRSRLDPLLRSRIRALRQCVSAEAEQAAEDMTGAFRALGCVDKPETENLKMELLERSFTIIRETAHLSITVEVDVRPKPAGPRQDPTQVGSGAIDRVDESETGPTSVESDSLPPSPSFWVRPIP